MNETLRQIDRRVSLRTYADRPIEEEHVGALLDSAIRAPTAGNMMLYSILRVRDSSKRKELAETCGHSFIENAPLVLVFLADMQRWVDYFEGSGVRERCEQEGEKYLAPDAARLLVSCCDALVAAQNTVIAAESLGIGSCYVGDIMGRAEEHRALLDLPQFAFPIALLCFGYYPEGYERRRSDRFGRRFIVHDDVYRRATHEDLDEMLGGIRRKLASVLEKRGMNLGQLTYGGLMAGPTAIQQRESVELLLKPWLDDKL